MFFRKFYRSLMFLTTSDPWCIASVVCITLVSGGIGGCGGGDVVTPPTETEVPPTETEVVEPTVPVVEVLDRYDGKSIIFVADGTIHEGHVIEGISEDVVLVRLADGSEVPIAVIRIKGTLIANHPDLGTEVVMLSEQEGERRLRGEIIQVYDGVRKIEIFGITFDDGRVEWLDVPRIRFVHKDTNLEDGGYLTLDEFAELLDN